MQSDDRARRPLAPTRPLALNRAPPTIGQHSREVMAEFGFGPDEVDAFIAGGAAVGTGAGASNAPAVQEGGAEGSERSGGSESTEGSSDEPEP